MRTFSISLPRLSLLPAALTLALLPGCTTTGTGVGNSRAPGASAVFQWTAQSARSGTMTADLADGRRFSGRFFQITRETRVDELAPLWVGWRGPFGPRMRRGGWGYWEPSPRFITEYSGRVLANLAGPGGQMRCRFRLVRPSSGMSGGGEGRCQLGDGAVIRAHFPSH